MFYLVYFVVVLFKIAFSEQSRWAEVTCHSGIVLPLNGFQLDDFHDFLRGKFRL
nr:MAG TPA: hypothetical protein [Caudoviricetes sp.]